jgi:HD superfamily phosphohydrolase YqeK
MRKIKTFALLLLALMLSLSVFVNSQVQLLEDKKESISEYEEEINKFLSELKVMLQEEIKENNRNTNRDDDPKNCIRSDLLEKIKNLNREKLWDLSMKVELLFTPDEKQAKINLEKWEKSGIIDYLTRKFGDKPELKELFKHLQEKSCQELRRIAKDIEYRYEPDHAQEIIEKVEKIYIIDYLTVKDREDKQKVEKFMEEYLKDQHIPLPIGGLHEYLATKKKDDLIDIALAIEFYHRKITGDPEKPNYHEKLHLMSEHDLREHIIEEVEEHPELEDSKMIDQILIEYRNYKPPKNTPEINTYLMSLKREDLMKLAFQTEKIHKKSIGAEGTTGGLHDYIWRLNDDEIREIIKKESQEHSECNSAEKLKTLMNQPGASDKPTAVMLLAEPDEKIKNYLLSLNRDDLMKLAFETEEVHKKATGGSGSYGGLHDYIWELSDDEIRQIIMKESDEHEEINSKEKLMALMGNNIIFTSNLATNNEVKNYLLTLKRQDLMKLAYETEKVHKKATGSEGTMGGYHDYIWRMSDDEVREIIIKESNEHVEIDSKEKLMALLSNLL